MNKRRIIKTNFYADGRSVWISETPDILEQREMAVTINMLAEKGYGAVTIVTDSTGRAFTV